MTDHLVDAIFLAIANKSWNALKPEQRRKLQAAAQSAAQYNNENRVREEAQLVEFFKQQGLTVTTPDRDAFRKHVQQVYLNSEYAKIWPKGLLDRINQTTA
jgi:TRAP-type C4-dicarboxylate transport system substrate-binding protein